MTIRNILCSRAQLGKQGDWQRAVEVYLEMQMAELEPSRSVINALMLVFENGGHAKQVRPRGMPSLDTGSACKVTQMQNPPDTSGQCLSDTQLACVLPHPWPHLTHPSLRSCEHSHSR